jgi:protein-S-isoprenylcysteine O-methyltransferase Ste14
MRRAGELLFSHVVPAALFGTYTVVKGGQVFGAAAATVTGSGIAPAGLLLLVVQLLGLTYFGLLAVLFAIRLPRLGGRRTLWTIAVALFATFAVLTIGVLPENQPRPALLGLGAAIVGVGLVYSIWALFHLGRSFSILPESRRLVRSGPYALSRHPLYLGETFAAVGVLLPVAGLPAMAMWLLNVAAQLLRIHWEEEVLQAQFPDYASYARQVPRYLPFVG